MEALRRIALSPEIEKKRKQVPASILMKLSILSDGIMLRFQDLNTFSGCKNTHTHIKP